MKGFTRISQNQNKKYLAVACLLMVSLSVLMVPLTAPEDFNDRVKLRVVTLQCCARQSEKASETFK